MQKNIKFALTFLRPLRISDYHKTELDRIEGKFIELEQSSPEYGSIISKRFHKHEQYPNSMHTLFFVTWKFRENTWSSEHWLKFEIQFRILSFDFKLQ